jgi:soluble lytic murein transglycosylase-like protein
LSLASSRTAALALCLLASLASESRAQVLAIDPQGAVSVYDGPAVVTSDGATPLRRAQAGADAQAEAATAPIAQAVARSAARHGLDPALLMAVGWRESRFQQRAISPKGAVGVMQLMPATARSLGVDPHDLTANIEGGATYLAQLLRLFGGDVPLSLAAYNAGPGAVARFHGAPPFTETTAYVQAVLASWSAGRATGEGITR